MYEGEQAAKADDNRETLGDGIERAEKAVAVLGEKVDMLLGRLDAVLLPEKVAPDVNAVALDRERSDYGRGIKRIAEKADRITDRVHSAVMRLEL
jgi:exopolysaccharide biosynthesis predicted pyruvyltransferase EpsI